MNKRKPLGKRSYGSIGHLPNSRLGEGDHKITDGQARIATEKFRDKNDVIIIQEKLDGSNVGIAKINNEIIPLTGAGYVANTSPFRMHHVFYDWVLKYKYRYTDLLEEGERLCGEWLLIAHGTRYRLLHEPFVAFDLMKGNDRRIYTDFTWRVQRFGFTVPNLISYGKPLCVSDVMGRLELSGHGALDPVEGAVWRVERNEKVDFLCKYVRPDKVDGIYLDQDLENEILVKW